MSEPTRVMNFRVAAQEKAEWAAAARRAGVSLSAYIRETVNVRVGREALVSGAQVEPPAAADPELVAIAAYMTGTGLLSEQRAAANHGISKPIRQKICQHRVPPGTACGWGCDD